MSIFQQQAEQLIAEYEARRARTSELRRQAGEIRATATSARGAIKVTVGIQGEISAIEFPTSAYKRMPPRELSDALIATIGEAREQAMAQFQELMAPEMPKGLNFTQLLPGKTDVAAPSEADIPQVVREHLSGTGVPGRERRPS